MTNDGLETLLWWLAIYFAPWLVSLMRRHRSKLAIFITNLVFGWTLLGWIIALIWACTGNVEEKRKPA